MSIPNQHQHLMGTSSPDYSFDFEMPCTREEMVHYIQSQDIKAIKESLEHNKLFETILSKNLCSTEELSQLLNSAVEYNQEEIEEISSEDNWGSIDPDDLADPLLEKLIVLLIKHHSFTPEVLGAALISCSRLGRCDLIPHILNTRKVLPEHMEAAFLKGIEKGWLEVVDLFLADPKSNKFSNPVWIDAFQLSCEWGAHAIACSLIKATETQSRLNEIKSQLEENKELLNFINELTKEIEEYQEFYKSKLEVKRIPSFELPEPQNKRRKYSPSSE